RPRPGMTAPPIERCGNIDTRAPTTAPSSSKAITAYTQPCGRQAQKIFRRLVLGIFLIAAAKNPAENCSLISFTIWLSVVHAAIMAVQALYNSREHSHLVGDVPALLLVARVLWFLSPTKKVAMAR